MLIVMFIAAICCTMTYQLGLHYRILYRRTTDVAKQRLIAKDQELTERWTRRVAKEPGDIVEGGFGGSISTTDQTNLYTYYSNPGTAVTNGQRFGIVQGKGAFMEPEIRLRAGSTNVYALEIRSEPDFGNIVDVWLSYADGYDALVQFEQFHIYRAGTNTMKLIVQAKPGASCRMWFGVSVLKERVELP